MITPNHIKVGLVLLLLSVICYAPTMSSSPKPLTQEQTSNVIVNNERLSDEVVSLMKRNGIAVQDGRYWYDNKTGAWGLEGEPTYGFLLANLHLGGPLQSDASMGDTGVFINGRELAYQDVQALQQLLQVQQGRYWVDANGYAGYEGGPALCNLVQLANQKSSQFYRNSYTGISAGSSGGTSYVMGKDWSVIID